MEPIPSIQVYVFFGMVVLWVCGYYKYCINTDEKVVVKPKVEGYREEIDELDKRQYAENKAKLFEYYDNKRGVH